MTQSTMTRTVMTHSATTPTTTTRTPTTMTRNALLLGALALAGLAATAMPATAQSPQEREVVSVIERFFEGMLQRDADILRSTVDPTAQLSSAAVRNGQTTFTVTPIEQFINAITSRQGEPANERIYAPNVQIDGNLANVWTFYTLHIGERFSHCGYDSFQLLKGDDGWKIVHVADSRRNENCEPPGG